MMISAASGSQGTRRPLSSRKKSRALLLLSSGTKFPDADTLTSGPASPALSAVGVIFKKLLAHILANLRLMQSKVRQFGCGAPASQKTLDDFCWETDPALRLSNALRCRDLHPMPNNTHLMKVILRDFGPVSLRLGTWDRWHPICPRTPPIGVLDRQLLPQ